MKKTVLLLMGLLIIAILKLQAQPNAWINEIHYDNAGSDTGEFVEIVIENAGTYTLSDFQLDLYNGSTSQTYNTKTLDAFLQGITSGNFTFFTYSYPTDGIQNGAPDGLSLSYQGTVITGQFLSYEGTLTASNGPASGLTSTDIGVSESSVTPVGYSLQLAGSGTQYGDFSWQDAAANTLGDLNNSQSLGGVVYPQIVRAWSISSTAIDVLYNLDVTSIDPGDYYMTGSAYIEFGSATIDGSNPKLVHLSSPDSPIDNDVTLDQLFDAANSTDIQFYAGILDIANTNASTSNTAGLMQNGYTATFQGIVSANDSEYNFWVSDATGGYNGVMVYTPSLVGTVNVGDEILFSAERDVFNDNSELANAEIISQTTGGTPYGPSVILGSDIESTIAANTDPGEIWEGQLVKIEDFTVVGPAGFNYECTWSDAKATYTFYIGDNVTNSLTLVNGISYSAVTGVIDWYGSGPFYRINPRSQDDIEGGNVPYKLAIISVNDGADPYENTNFNVVVQVQDNAGNPAVVSSQIDFTFSANTGTSGVDFTVGSVITGSILTGTSETTVTGVQMAPSGTGVTITATDDDPFGLVAGASSPFDVLELPSYIVYQGFETSGDTWGFTPDPASYNVSGDVWAPVTGLSTINPAFGLQFWGMQDLNNPNGGGNFWHYLNFAPIDISSYGNVLLSFQYHTIGFDISDELGYVVEYDNGSTWGDPVLLEKNTNAWVTVNINVPPGSPYVRLRLQAFQDGSTDYAGWDDVKLEEFTFEPAAQLAVISVNEGTDPYTQTDFEVVVQAQDISGDPALVDGDVSFTLTTNGGDGMTASFMPGTTVSGTILNGTSEITLTGVQMQVSGASNETNVTITAADNAPGGLTAGTSDPFTLIYVFVPDIVITEIMNDPSGDENLQEWFEVYNNSASPVDMNGWILKDLGGNIHTIGSSVIVPAYGFIVLGQSSEPLSNGGYTCNYVYSTFFLANGDDEIIIILPNGVTEVDRVEWDGGPIWPDPTGASMVYTGLASEDNNDGTLWATSMAVEDTYTNPEGDLGSPGTNGSDQVLTEGFSLDINVLLEGAYDMASHSMTSDLILPYEQPFGPALPYYGNSLPLWQYEGTETSPSIAGAVTTDWILVELRDESYSDAGTGIQIPALLEVDGQVCSYNGSRRLSIKSDFFTGLYIVIWHRNHLGIMSATGLTPVEGTLVSYDFTTGLDKVYNATADDYKELETGVWGMAAGDVNADGAIDDLDVVDGWATDAGNEGYLGGDLNMDRQTNNQDKNDYWIPNNGASYHIPF